MSRRIKLTVVIVAVVLQTALTVGSLWSFHKKDQAQKSVTKNQIIDEQSNKDY